MPWESLPEFLPEKFMGCSRYPFVPLGLVLNHLLFTAYAVGGILAPLRGFELAAGAIKLFSQALPDFEVLVVEFRCFQRELRGAADVARFEHEG